MPCPQICPLLEWLSALIIIEFLEHLVLEVVNVADDLPKLPAEAHLRHIDCFID